MKRIALAAVLLVTLVGPVRAGFDEADAAYVRGDYATALKEYRALAEQQRAIEMLRAAGRDDEVADFHTRFRLYARGQPYRE